jgi:hypothetical protein
VSFLTTRVRCPDVDDKQKLLRVLNGSQDLCLVFQGDGSRILKLNSSIDASFGIHGDEWICCDDGRSQR